LISDLTEAGAVALCAEIASASESVISEEQLSELGCTLFALLFGGADDAASCERSKNECLGLGGMSTTSTECDAEGLRAAGADCAVTTRQFGQCLIAGAQQASNILGAFQCEVFSDPNKLGELLATEMGPESLPECAEIVSMCPDVLEPDKGEPAADGCDETCSDAMDDFCDDGGPGSLTDLCALGTDCTDCGPR
jgi:hypothetical protein